MRALGRREEGSSRDGTGTTTTAESGAVRETIGDEEFPGEETASASGSAPAWVYLAPDGTRARRKPRLRCRYPGSNPLRCAARQLQAKLSQPPPRITRQEPGSE